jgi:hypothetical protein
MNRSEDQHTLIGWREWIGFPNFENVRVKAKIDTGARTSAIHADSVEIIERDGRAHVSFIIHPNQNDNENTVACVAPLIDRRAITDSGGKTEKRCVVSTLAHLGNQTWSIELSLTDRDSMGFRMLLGRTALRKRFWVQPDKSFLHGGNKNGPSKSQQR